MAAQILLRQLCPWVEILQLINDWIKIPYLDYGRDAAGADCWGLTRLVRQALRGDVLGNYLWISPDDKPHATQAARDTIAAGWETGPAVPGSIATVWRFGLFIHSGVVIECDGMLGVIDTSRKTGARWQRLTDFERHHRQVIYYDKG